MGQVQDQQALFQNLGPNLSKAEWRSCLRCPVCRAPLSAENAKLACTECQRTYPVVDSIPVLLDDEHSIFSQSEFIERADTYWVTDTRKGLRKLWRKFAPKSSINLVSKENYERYLGELRKRGEKPKILVIGGRQMGKGMEPIFDNVAEFHMYELDVSYGPRTSLIGDSHWLPFADGTIDAIICQGVIEHLMDPYRTVEEMVRVLKDDGLVYAETAFMQQVHANRYDFLRFSPLAHRALFRHFDEICSGSACGPGMALSWAVNYAVLSLSDSKQAHRFLWPLSSFLAWPYKYLDMLVIRHESSLDGCSGSYFMGRKAKNPLSDREIMKLYRGRN